MEKAFLHPEKTAIFPLTKPLVSAATLDVKSSFYGIHWQELGSGYLFEVELIFMEFYQTI